MMIHILGGSATSSIYPYPSQKAIQPNAIDLSLKEVWSMGAYIFTLTEEEKYIRPRVPLEPSGSSKMFVLDPGAYEIILGTGDPGVASVINIGADEAGIVIPRSTLNRNGVYITSGLYDSGYTGPMTACLHVTTGPFHVGLNTRLAQFVLMKAEALHMYNGQYNVAR